MASAGDSLVGLVRLYYIVFSSSAVLCCSLGMAVEQLGERQVDGMVVVAQVEGCGCGCGDLGVGSAGLLVL